MINRLPVTSMQPNWTGSSDLTPQIRDRRNHPKRFWVGAIACFLLLFSLTVGGVAIAQPSGSLPPIVLAESLPKDVMKQLETEILPQLEHILNPEQLEQFKTGIGDGVSFRKLFKTILLTPEQKNQLKALFKTMSPKNAFATMTPEQKKQLFSKKRELFAPTADEIQEKIDAAIQGKGSFIPEVVKQKIEVGIQKMEQFQPKTD